MHSPTEIDRCTGSDRGASSACATNFSSDRAISSDQCASLCNRRGTGWHLDPGWPHPKGDVAERHTASNFSEGLPYVDTPSRRVTPHSLRPQFFFEAWCGTDLLSKGVLGRHVVPLSRPKRLGVGLDPGGTSPEGGVAERRNVDFFRRNLRMRALPNGFWGQRPFDRRRYVANASSFASGWTSGGRRGGATFCVRLQVRCTPPRLVPWHSPGKTLKSHSVPWHGPHESAFHRHIILR